MGTDSNYYPEFDYSATELSAYAYSVGTFIISLKGGKMVHFSPEDAEAFKAWLTKHKVRDISVDDGISKHLHTDFQQKKNKRR